MEEKSNTNFTEAQAASYLKRSTTTMWRLRKARVLPYSKFGGKILYRKTDLDKFISDNLIGA